MQLKEKRENKGLNRSQLLIVGSLIFLIGLSILGYKIYSNYYFEKQNNDSIEEFIKNEQENKVVDNVETNNIKKEEIKNRNYEKYIAVIEIPSIKLKSGMYDKTSKNNNVNRSIEILKEADMPNVINGNFIIAGHSGSGKATYFKDLYKVGIEDVVNIYFDGNKYVYKVIKIYDVDKNGTVQLSSYKDKNILTMITCRQNTNKQIVVICELIEKM